MLYLFLNSKEHHRLALNKGCHEKGFLPEICCVAEAVSALTYPVSGPHPRAHRWSLTSGT